MVQAVIFYLKIYRESVSARTLTVLLTIYVFDGGSSMFYTNLVPFTVIMGIMQVFQITVTA